MSKKLPTLSAETLARYNGCTACAYLQGMTQCNNCRANRPNRQTLVRRETTDLQRELMAEGMDRTDAGREAERRMGLTGKGYVIGG